MNQRMVIAALCTAMMAVFGFTYVTPAVAHESSGVGQEATREAQIALVEAKLVRRANGTLALPVNSVEGVDPAFFQELRDSLKVTNKKISNGELKSTKLLEVYPTEVAYREMSQWGSQWYTKWWGIEAHVSAYYTSKITGAGTFSGGVTALANALKQSPKNPFILAAIALGTGAILVCRNSNGVELKRNWAGPAWCNGHNN